MSYLDASFWKYYLLICSILGLSLVIERILFFMTLRRLHKASCSHIQNALERGRFPDECPEIRSSALKEALQLLLSHHAQNAVLRREIMEGWLETHKQEVLQRLGWFTIIAWAAFLGGLMALALGCFHSLDILTSFSPHEFIPKLKHSFLFLLYGMAISFLLIILRKIFLLWGTYYLNAIQKSLKVIILSISDMKCPGSTS